MMPETFDFIDVFAARARALGLEVLVEVHSHHRKQIEIAKRVDWVYDFALPPLVLHAFFFKTARYLKAWLTIRPSNAVTVLDTHDGIGIIDIGADPADRIGAPGLVPPAEVDKLVEMIHAHSQGQSREATGAAASNLDLYQVNCTFFDAMGRDERSYLLARAIQFFMPGVPQVYYVGLLAGRNDMKLLASTRVGRDINRHHYTRVEVEQTLAEPVVQQLLSLIRIRNTHPAFNGSFAFDGATDQELSMRWTHGKELAALFIDFADLRFELQFDGAAGPQKLRF
jgi:sucrose phosphorylase